jgi:hypothetical protein
MTVNKNMISEPTFISSTSSVPLVGLPHARVDGSATAPPTLPAMNPRRRGGTPTNENGSAATSAANTPLATPLGMAVPSATGGFGPGMGKSVSATNSPALGNTPTAATFDSIFHGKPGAVGSGPMGPPPPKNSGRNRLRKISSEGGGMAIRARQQAVWAEREREDRLTPRDGEAKGFPFPNKSATNLGLGRSATAGGAGTGRMQVEEGGMF